MKSHRKNLFELAQTQAGYFTSTQAKECGYAPYHHSYHVTSGNWIREMHGIYRLAEFPESESGRYYALSFFFRNREGEPNGVIALETALAMRKIGDFLPSKIYMAVKSEFRKSAKIPSDIVLVKIDFSERDYDLALGFPVMLPFLSIIHLLQTNRSEEHLVRDAYLYIKRNGLAGERDVAVLKKGAPEIYQKLISWEKGDD